MCAIQQLSQIKCPQPAVSHRYCNDNHFSIPRHLYFQWKELWAVKGAQRWFSPRLTQCGSHIHFSGHVIQSAERGNIPAPRCQEARGDGGDGRLYYTEKHRRGGNRGREMCIMKLDAAVQMDRFIELNQINSDFFLLLIILTTVLKLKKRTDSFLLEVVLKKYSFKYF